MSLRSAAACFPNRATGAAAKPLDSAVTAASGKLRFLRELPTRARRCLSPGQFRSKRRGLSKEDGCGPSNCFVLEDEAKLARHALERIVGAGQRVGQQQNGHSFLQAAVLFGKLDGAQRGIEPRSRRERRSRAK